MIYTFDYFFKKTAVSVINIESCFQSLLVLSYLLKNGSERVVQSARDHLYDMRQLENYQHIDELGKDQGLNSKLPGFVELLNTFIPTLTPLGNWYFRVYQV